MKDPKAATEQFRVVTQLFPFTDTGYIMLGKTLAQLDDRAGAMANYRQAIRLKPTQYLSHMHLGKAYEQLSQFQKAQTHYEQVIDLVPTLETGYNLLSIMLYGKKRCQEAAEVCREGLQLIPDSEKLQQTLERIQRKKEL